MAKQNSNNDFEIGHIAKEVDNKIKHAETRAYFETVIGDYVDSVPFMKKVREYAGYEIDSRLFTSFKFWAVTVISSSIAAVIGGVGMFFFTK